MYLKRVPGVEVSHKMVAVGTVRQYLCAVTTATKYYFWSMAFVLIHGCGWDQALITFQSVLLKECGSDSRLWVVLSMVLMQ